ncbi:ParB/RepB/Spo0J family partition protein [Clostridium butyricum]|uniref:ParB/RepB/Spo0J family partition protein n=1 Tax=Clostridium butyricum TaxID=1492 RepID=UPI00374E937A
MNSNYMELEIDLIELDYENPRIAKFVELYGDRKLSAEQIALALGGGTDSKNGVSYAGLKESIKTNGGVIHPIIVNKTCDNKYVVIEGNTRVQIYKEFKKNKVPGNWDTIRAIVYIELDEHEIHAIRLQSHLVGPRDWDPYSKAKYLNYLSNQEKLPMSQIISFCGGKQSEIRKFIDAYNDMENFYRGNLDDDSEFDQRDFSKYIELQNASVKEAILTHEFDLDDFSNWVINGNIDSAQNVRKIPAILKNAEAKKVFLKSNVSEAIKILAVEEIDLEPLNNYSYDVLAGELIKKLQKIEYKEVDRLQHDPRYDAKKEKLIEALNELKWIVEKICEEE